MIDLDGVGLFFMPSGIAYYENTSSGIPEYSPLIFSVKLMTYTPTDHDNDGILSIDEDIDGDAKPFGDDSDGDEVPLSSWNAALPPAQLARPASYPRWPQAKDGCAGIEALLAKAFSNMAIR